MVDLLPVIQGYTICCMKSQNYVVTPLEINKAEWKAYLSNIQERNHIVSFLHHRFDIYFALGGGSYYHQHHLKDFISKLDSTTFLHTSIASYIGSCIYLAGFRVLGIFNKLVTGPIFHTIEEDGHIFDLNLMWSDLKVSFERCGKDASELLEGECLIRVGVIIKDVIFYELFCETNDHEIDTLTQECLEIICCTCKIADQLP